MKRWLSTGARLLPSQWPADAAGRKNMALLAQLRWIAIAGQVATILFVHWGMGISLPVAAMLLVASIGAAVNVTTLATLRRRTDVAHIELFLALVFDVLLLTTQLYLSGGATNPFIALYLLQVALGAVLLDRWSIWGIVLLSLLCAAMLSLVYRPLELTDALEGRLFDLHILGTWICLAMIAVLLVLFMSRVTRNLQAREAYLAQLRQQAAEEEHLLKSFIEVGMVGGLPICGTPEGLEAVKALQPLIDAGATKLKACTSVTSEGVMWQAVIHGLFILSAIGIAWTDRIMMAGTSKHAHH